MTLRTGKAVAGDAGRVAHNDGPCKEWLGTCTFDRGFFADMAKGLRDLQAGRRVQFAEVECDPAHRKGQCGPRPRPAPTQVKGQLTDSCVYGEPCAPVTKLVPQRAWVPADPAATNPVIKNDMPDNSSGARGRGVSGYGADRGDDGRDVRPGPATNFPTRVDPERRADERIGRETDR